MSTLQLLLILQEKHDMYRNKDSTRFFIQCHQKQRISGFYWGLEFGRCCRFASLGRQEQFQPARLQFYLMFLMPFAASICFKRLFSKLRTENKLFML